MNKKIMALLIIAIFLIGLVPMAFAKEANEKKIGKEDVEKAKERFIEAKERLEKVKTKYSEQRTEFIEKKEALKECNSNDSEECEAIKGEFKKQAKNHLTSAADLILEELEKLKANIESSEDLSEDEKAEMLADIESKIADVEEAKSVIEGADDASAEEINEASQFLRDTWKETKAAIKKHSARAANARLGYIVLRVEQLETKLYKTRDRLEARGADVSALDARLQEFSDKVDLAAEKYEQARLVWSEAKTSGNFDDAASEIHDLLVQSKEALKEARELLREIVNEIKSLNSGSLELADDDEEETSETETEDESEEETNETEDASGTPGED